MSAVQDQGGYVGPQLQVADTITLDKFYRQNHLNFPQNLIPQFQPPYHQLNSPF